MKARKTIRRSEVVEMRKGAAEAGDMEQVAVCDAALSGDRGAIEECVRVLNDAVAAKWAPRNWSRPVRKSDDRDFRDLADLYVEGAALEMTRGR
jgi:hypothetical protein